ncbi:MAG: phenylalanine--tRNA ligase subunit beta [Candidatus Omnitrophica bacterium]|nr:phenylalanine--tRNA ligase subunit beta [Candidatus Omnitrophota bacterium]
MKINYNWLKEYIDVKKPLDDVVKLLTMSGSEVKAVDDMGGDPIMDIEITPNRSDCLSYIGLARELAALTGKEIKMPPLKMKKQKAGKPDFAVEIKDKDLCPRYTARLIRGVVVGESPAWLKDKLISMGLKPVNNVVDITNFVLFELGQPMHAFDHDKILGKSIIIRRARSGEKITAIDQSIKPLEKNMLIIADKERPIAIGGVMGGLDTEVSTGTKDILLESAYFDPVSVRRTSYRLTLASESSYRFERGVDAGMVLSASDRAALLIAKICGGEICGLLDKGVKPGRDRTITLRADKANRVLDLKLSESRVKKILSALSLKSSSSKKGVLKVSIPSFRGDLKYEMDLVEEIARIYGYENIGLTIPRIISNPERKSLSWKAQDKVKETLTSLGLNEVITYGLLGKQVLNMASVDLSTTIPIKNPMSAEQELMRPALLPGILNVMSHNINRGVRDLKIFEIGAVYSKGADNRYREKTHLAIAMTGLFSGDWQRQKNNVTFFDLKGSIEALLNNLGLDVEKLEFSLPDILYSGENIGRVPALSHQTLDAFGLKQDILLAEIAFDELIGHINLEKKLKDIPKFPSIKRDVSLVAGPAVTFSKIATIAKEEGGDLIERIELFDRYTGKQIPKGHHGLSIRVEYRGKEKTLTSEDVDKAHSDIRKALAEKPGVTLR